MNDHNPQPPTPPQPGRQIKLAPLGRYEWTHPPDLLPVNCPKPPGTARLPTFVTNPPVLAAIITALSQGAYMEPAAEAAGISRETLNDWMRRGNAVLREHGSPDDWPEPGQPGGEGGDGGPKPGDKMYARLAMEVARAQAHAELAATKTLYEASLSDWRAAKAYLESRFSGRWAPAAGGVAAQVRLGDASASVIVLPTNAREAKSEE